MQPQTPSTHHHRKPSLVRAFTDGVTISLLFFGVLTVLSIQISRTGMLFFGLAAVLWNGVKQVLFRGADAARR